MDLFLKNTKKMLFDSFVMQTKIHKILHSGNDQIQQHNMYLIWHLPYSVVKSTVDFELRDKCFFIIILKNHSPFVFALY